MGVICSGVSRDRRLGVMLCPAISDIDGYAFRSIPDFPAVVVLYVFCATGVGLLDSWLERPAQFVTDLVPHAVVLSDPLLRS